jgi:signal transduction histidine kinase
MALPNFRRRMVELAPDLGEVAVQFGAAGAMARPAILNGSVRLADDTFLNFGATLAEAASPWTTHSTLFSTTLMAGGVVAVAAMLLRSLVRPLRRLAAAADAIGRGPDVAVAETGPDEVRQVAQAFNGMQARIHRLMQDRTQALAAVSHDLRTPITRLRLRAGFLADPEVQAAIDADLEEMEGMIEATLAYLRGDTETETAQVTDLAALLSTLTDNVCDAGGAATYAGPNHVAIELRPSAVKRAFANLVNNAMTYGGSVQVTVSSVASGVTVKVEDTGPGISSENLERVFQPFQRLENSRNRGTGGVGLGLAIARQAIENEGGSIRLSNRQSGGLSAEVFLPCRSMDRQDLPPWQNRAARYASHSDVRPAENSMES